MRAKLQGWARIGVSLSRTTPALQAATAALAAAGYPASRDSHHYRVFQSLEYTINADAKLIRSLDAFRKKLNHSSYEMGGLCLAGKPRKWSYWPDGCAATWNNGFGERIRNCCRESHRALQAEIPGRTGSSPRKWGGLNPEPEGCLPAESPRRSARPRNLFGA